MAFPMNVAVASATRTAVGRALKGSLRDTRPDDLAAVVMVEAVRRVKGLSAADLDDVVLGCAMPEAEQGLNMARNAVFLAGFPDSVPGQTVNRFCASGLQSVAVGATAIHAGLQHAVLAGGVESMSAVPMSGNKVSLNPRLVDERPEAYIAMGHTAETVAERFGVAREVQDAFALRSHHNAVAAIGAGRFKAEIAAVPARRFTGGAAGFTTFDTDEMPRADTSLAVLGKLRPAFSAKGSVTAGNSSPLSDGAAALVLLSDSKLRALEVQPVARILASVVVGVPPDVMGIGPLPAIQKLLALTGLKVADIALFEINEAFAAQAVYCQRELGIADAQLNVNGGGIALGHPLGATGSKLACQLVHALPARGGGYGVASMCIGGGMGYAMLLKVD